MPAKSRTVWLGLGSNLDNPLAQLQFAYASLNRSPCRVLATSSIYRSSPMGPQDQDEFLNAAMAIETELQPRQLLAHLKQLESAAGRTSGLRWGSRQLDLDILLIDALEMCTDELTVPHKGLNERNFVLVPLLELGAKFRLPAQWGERLATALQELNRGGDRDGKTVLVKTDFQFTE